MLRKNETMSKFKNTKKLNNVRDIKHWMDSNESLVNIINDPFSFTIRFMVESDWEVSFYSHFRIYKTIKKGT